MSTLLIARSKQAALATFFLVSFTGAALAQSTDGRSTAEVEKENAALRAKIHRLEVDNENLALRAKVDQLQGRRRVQTATPESSQNKTQPLVTRIEASSPDRTLVMADMPVKTPVAPLRVLDWSGVYVGLEGGYGWSKQNLNAIIPGVFDVANAGLANGTNTPDLAIQSGTLKGWLAGGFGGVQKQWGSWVFGLEGDFDAAGLKNNPVSASGTTNIFVGNVGGLGVCGTATAGNSLCETHNVTFASQIDELGSLRAKVGFAPTPNFLIYGTGGLGFAHVKNSLSDTNQSTLRFNPTVVISAVTADGGTSMLGGAVGAGFDWKWNTDAGAAWVFGAEYLHYDFGAQTLTVSNNAGVSSSFRSSVTADAVKGRISYLFGIH